MIEQGRGKWDGTALWGWASRALDARWAWGLWSWAATRRARRAPRAEVKQEQG